MLFRSELPSYCSAESVPVVELLMEIPNPDQRIVAAVDGAMKWFDSHKIMNTRIERYINEDGERDVRVLNDKNADPVWARYYDLKTEKAFFCDRNGIPLETLAEVGYERRNGYSWYSQKPAMLYNKYEEWRKANRIAMK